MGKGSDLCGIVPTLISFASVESGVCPSSCVDGSRHRLDVAYNAFQRRITKVLIQRHQIDGRQQTNEMRN